MGYKWIGPKREGIRGAWESRGHSYLSHGIYIFVFLTCAPRRSILPTLFYAEGAKPGCFRYSWITDLCPVDQDVTRREPFEVLSLTCGTHRNGAADLDLDLELRFC